MLQPLDIYLSRLPLNELIDYLSQPRTYASIPQSDQQIDTAQEAFERQQDSEYDRRAWDEIAGSDAGIRIRGEI